MALLFAGDLPNNAACALVADGLPSIQRDA
jgi:hypothetical protein